MDNGAMGDLMVMGPRYGLRALPIKESTSLVKKMAKEPSLGEDVKIRKQ